MGEAAPELVQHEPPEEDVKQPAETLRLVANQDVRHLTRLVVDHTVIPLDKDLTDRPALDHHTVAEILRSTNGSYPAQRYANLARYTFDLFAKQIEADPTIFPGADELMKKYARAGEYLAANRDRSISLQIIMEELEEVTDPLSDLTPLGIAKDIAKGEVFRKGVKVSEIMIRLWVVDTIEPQLDLSSDFERTREIAERYQQRPSNRLF